MTQASPPDDRHVLGFWSLAGNEQTCTVHRIDHSAPVTVPILPESCVHCSYAAPKSTLCKEGGGGYSKLSVLLKPLHLKAHCTLDPLPQPPHILRHCPFLSMPTKFCPTRSSRPPGNQLIVKTQGLSGMKRSCVRSLTLAIQRSARPNMHSAWWAVAQLTPENPIATTTIHHACLQQPPVTLSTFEDLATSGTLAIPSTPTLQHHSSPILQGCAPLLRHSRRPPLHRPRTPPTDFHLRSSNPHCRYFGY